MKLIDKRISDAEIEAFKIIELTLTLVASFLFVYAVTACLDAGWL